MRTPWAGWSLVTFVAGGIVTAHWDVIRALPVDRGILWLVGIALVLLVPFVMAIARDREKR